MRRSFTANPELSEPKSGWSSRRRMIGVKLQAAGVLKVHAFRHSAAFLINAETGNLKLAQGLLGHSEISTTADAYTHTSNESQREAISVIERAIFGSVPPSCSSGEQGW